MLTLRTRPKIEGRGISLQQREKELFKTDGPRLDSFRVYGVESPFSKFIPKNCVKLEPTRNSLHLSNIRLNSDRNSNLRAFYFLLLNSCFDGGFEMGSESRPICKFTERGRQLFDRLRAFILTDIVNLQQFAGVAPDPNQHKLFRQPRLAKRLILQVMHVLCTQPRQDILSTVSKYPIVDTVLLMLMRGIVASHRPDLVNPDRKIETEVVADSLREGFGVRIEANAFEMFYQEQFVIREDNDYTYVKRHAETVKHQSDTTKKTEESDNNLSSSHIFDKKILGETINPSIPPLTFNTQKIASLYDIRQCSSKRNSFEDQTGRKMSMQEGNETGRDPKDPRKPRDVISEIDESCQSSMSCVIQRIEFGKQQSSRNASPLNSPRKRNSPSKFTKIKVDSTIPVIKAEPISKIRQQFPESPNFPSKVQKKVSQFSITSQGDQEEEAMDTLDEDIKLNLTDGTTSQAVLKLMSPSITKAMHQKKKQSLLSAMQKYNTNTSVSCIRGDTSLRTSSNTNPFSKLYSQCDFSDRNKKISPAARQATHSLYKDFVPYRSPKVVFSYNTPMNKSTDKVTRELRSTYMPRMREQKQQQKSLSPWRIAGAPSAKHFYQ